MRVGVIESLIKDGVRAGPYKVRVSRASRGRFKEEVNIDLAISAGAGEEPLLSMKVFQGRPPHYRPWIEVFNIRPEVRVGDVILRYFGSAVEDAVLGKVADALEAGEWVFVEYYRDGETLKALERGVPPPATRLGLKLLKLGFTWFKDWYYPEGFMEGGPKLQAGKPASRSHRDDSLMRLLEELSEFIESGEGVGDDVVRRAVARAREATDLIREWLRSPEP